MTIPRRSIQLTSIRLSLPDSKRKNKRFRAGGGFSRKGVFMFKRNCFAFGQVKRDDKYYLQCKVLRDVSDCNLCKTFKTWKQIFDEEENIIKPRMKELYPWWEFESSIPKSIRRRLEYEKKTEGK